MCGVSRSARTPADRIADEALVWFRIAGGLDRELRQVRAWLVGLLIWVAEREELVAFVRAEVDRRWPPDREEAPHG
jgi:hypothetical protein